jgi:hypothetical protein
MEELSRAAGADEATAAAAAQRVAALCQRFVDNIKARSAKRGRRKRHFGGWMAALRARQQRQRL